MEKILWLIIKYKYKYIIIIIYIFYTIIFFLGEYLIYTNLNNNNNNKLILKVYYCLQIYRYIYINAD